MTHFVVNIIFPFWLRFSRARTSFLPRARGRMKEGDFRGEEHLPDLVHWNGVRRE
jgi:hypothetical protein